MELSVAFLFLTQFFQCVHNLYIFCYFLCCCLLKVSGCGVRPFFQYALADDLLLFVFGAVSAVAVCSGAFIFSVRV